MPWCQVLGAGIRPQHPAPKTQYPNMEIWIAGATGVLGRRAVPLLMAAGHSVVGLARSSAKWPNLPPEMRFIPCDVTAAGQMTQVFAGTKPDVIVNLATAIPSDKPTTAAWARNDAVRREGTSNLVEAALLYDSYYIHLSSHFISAPAGDAWITEESPYAKAPPMVSAIDAERIMHKGLNQGMPGCVLQASTLYCEDSPQTRAIVQAIKQAKPVMIGNGHNYWSFVHPYDVATAILRAVERRPAGETYLISDDEPMRMADCLDFIARELHAHPPKSVAPFLAKLAIGGEMVDLLLGSRRVANAKAKRDLGWEPRYPAFRDGFAAEYLSR